MVAKKTVNPPAGEAVNTELRALGMIETRGLIALIEAVDEMVKAANVVLLEKRATGGGYVTAMIRGDVGAVRTALEAGSKAAQNVGELVSVKMLPSPHGHAEQVLPPAIQ
jgi:ethanolamine utilization protein EutM